MPCNERGSAGVRNAMMVGFYHGNIMQGRSVDQSNPIWSPASAIASAEVPSGVSTGGDSTKRKRSPSPSAMDTAENLVSPFSTHMCAATSIQTLELPKELIFQASMNCRV